MVSKAKKKEIEFLFDMFSKAPQTTLGIKKILKIDPLVGEAKVEYRAKKKNNTILLQTMECSRKIWIWLYIRKFKKKNYKTWW